MKCAVVAITRHGLALAGRVAAALPGARVFAPAKFAELAQQVAPGRAQCYEGKTAEQIPALFAAFDAIVAVVSLGAVVRLIAPHLRNKEQDPAVVVLDEAGTGAGLRGQGADLDLGMVEQEPQDLSPGVAGAARNGDLDGHAHTMHPSA